MHIPPIPGPALLGFCDEFVGAVPVTKPLPPKPSLKAAGAKPAGGTLPSNTIYGPAKKPKLSTVAKAHAQTIKAAKSTAQKAANAAVKALSAAKAKPAMPFVKPGARLRMTALGAVVPATPQPLTPRAKAALDKQKAAVQRAAEAAKKALDAGLHAKHAVVELAKKAKAQKAVSIDIRRKRPGKTGIRGLAQLGLTEIGDDMSALLGAYYAAVGAMPDPHNPGYLDDGSNDPAYWGDPSTDPMATDPAAGLDLGDLLSGSDPLEQDPGPPLPPDAHIPDMNAVGGIPYDGSKGHPPGYIGSMSYFYKTIVNPKYPERQYGFVFGGDPHNSAWPGNNFDKWVWVHGKKGDSGSIPDFPGQEPGVSGWWDNADQINPSYSDTGSIMKASLAKGYGVIMGNPAFPDFTGMRCDDAGNLFWLPSEAPDWLTAPLKLAADATAKAERDAAAAAAAADQAAMAKVKSDAALAQAQQDAANALAESQAASEQTIAQAQQETQAQQLDLDQAKSDQQAHQEDQQYAQQQGQLDLQQQQQASQLLVQQAQMEQDQQRQAQALLLEQARQEQEYLTQHPELEYGPAGGDEGGDEEAYESDEGMEDPLADDFEDSE